RRGRAGDVTHEVVVLGRRFRRPDAAKEERLATLCLIGRDRDSRQRVLQAGVAQVIGERLLQGAGLVFGCDNLLLVGQPGPGEDLCASLDVEVDELGGRVLRATITVTRTGQTEGENAARRGAGDDVEELRDRFLAELFDPGEDGGRDDAPDPSPVDGKDPEVFRVLLHTQLFAWLDHSSCTV